MTPSPVALPARILQRIPQYSFARLLIGQEGMGFVREQYVLERHPPIYVDNYKKILLNQGPIDIATVRIISHTPQDWIAVRSAFASYKFKCDVEETIEFGRSDVDAVRKCTHCFPGAYEVLLREAGVREGYLWDNRKGDYCCQTLLIGYDVPKPIKAVWKGVASQLK